MGRETWTYIFFIHFNMFTESEKRLRRDLRKTRALLKDAEIVIQKQTGAEGMKSTIRQLRNTVSLFNQFNL